MIERRIKELSIALEALSRINHYQATNWFDKVGELLAATIKDAEDPKPQTTTRPLDEEIPF